MIDQKLTDAFARMQIEPASTYDEANERYRDLIMVWHPDRLTSEKKKQKAEEELKLINNAWDIVKAHYKGSHKAEACRCREGAKSTPPPQPGPKPEKSTAEEEAKRRSDERARRAAQEAADKAATAANDSERERQKAAEQTVDPEKLAADEKLRWRIAICMGVAWLVLSGVGFTATSVKGWWTDFSDKWQRDHPPPQQQQTVVPPPPSGLTAEQLAQKARDEEAERQRQKDIDSAKQDIARYQGYLDKSNRLLADANAKIADPTIADVEKIKFRSDVTIQTDFIAKTQADLQTCQQRLATLTGQPIPPINPGAAPPLVDLDKLKQEPPAQKIDLLSPHWTPTKPESPLQQIYREQKQNNQSP